MQDTALLNTLSRLEIADYHLPFSEQNTKWSTKIELSQPFSGQTMDVIFLDY
jgi:hypothetical protein